VKAKKTKPCQGCNGTGQVTWFGGVSRFQFSYDECPECNGTGLQKAKPAKGEGSQDSVQSPLEGKKSLNEKIPPKKTTK